MSTKTATMTDKARALIAAGRVRLDEEGGSVTNDEGFTYRVDFDLGGHGPNCQCHGFQFTGHCKHLLAAQMARADYKQWVEDEHEYAALVGAGLTRWER